MRVWYYTIRLSKDDARRCREAAKAFNKGPLPDSGDQRFTRAEWHDLQDALLLHYCHARGLDIDERREFSRLSDRIVKAISQTTPEMVDEAEPVKAGCLF